MKEIRAVQEIRAVKVASSRRTVNADLATENSMGIRGNFRLETQAVLPGNSPR